MKRQPRVFCMMHVYLTVGYPVIIFGDYAAAVERMLELYGPKALMAVRKI